MSDISFYLAQDVPEKWKYSDDSRATQRFANLAQISNVTIEVFITVVVSVSVEDRVDDGRHGLHRQEVRVCCLTVVTLQDLQIMLQCMEIKTIHCANLFTSNCTAY